MTTIANPRAVIGGNNPPLAESIVMDFDNALRARQGLIERIDEMVRKAADAKPCPDAETAGRMGDFIKMTAAAVAAIEAEREIFNRPILTAQRALKARADVLIGKATDAGATVRSHLNAYLAEQERLRRAEHARLAEIERLAQVERQRLIDQAERDAEIERKRLQDIEDDRAAAENRQADCVEVAPDPVFVEDRAPVFEAAPANAAIKGDYGSTVSTVEKWDVKVTNIRQVPDTFLKHPSVIEALEKVIRPSVRGANGLRAIKGCDITSTLTSSIR